MSSLVSVCYCDNLASSTHYEYLVCFIVVFWSFLDNTAMTESQTPSPRSRLQALLAIPDNQRTEEQWDELHELEITLAPGNRIGQPEKTNPVSAPGRAGGRSAPPGAPRASGRGAPKGSAKGEGRSGDGRSGEARNAGRGTRPPRPVNVEDPIQPEVSAVEGTTEAPVVTLIKKPARRYPKKPPKSVEE
jgi:hypothetical protein